MKKRVGIILASFFLMQLSSIGSEKNCQGQILGHNKERKNSVENNALMAPNENGKVFKKILSNGMAVLVRPVYTIPQVSLQIWYNVGSKDEKSGEKGYAHLIEHMIFKGTKNLTESDLNAIAHTLSGSINAFTSWDYTGYLFNLPTQHWQQALPIMADCMQNAAFREEPLNSEMKTVIQELKMYRDSYKRSVIDELVSTIFVDHPYHYPVIGFKQDLWKVHGNDLHAFYDKHYWPNNATLVVVGDVEPEDVFALAEKEFGGIKPNLDYKKDEFYVNHDIASKRVTLYRDVQQPFVTLAWLVPGVKEKKEHVLEIASWILGAGKSSRLQKKLVNELQLVTSISTAYWDLFDHGLFFVLFEPKEGVSTDEIEAVIAQEIESINENGLTDEEVLRALKKAQMHLYNTLEHAEDQAYEIGKHFLATGDENYILEYLSTDTSSVKADVQAIIKKYLRPTLMHKGIVAPLPEKEKPEWLALQKEMDAEDAQILAARERKTELEPLAQALKTVTVDAKKFDFPKPEIATLSNELKLFYYQNKNTPKINLVLELKAKYYYDPDDKPGLYNFVSQVMTEGTQNYTADEFADALESRGMSLSVAAGYVTMSMLHDDFALGLDLLFEVLDRAAFDKKEVEKIRDQLLAEVKNFWDEPSIFSGQLIREQIYKHHPYSKNALGTTESIKKIGRKDLINFYQKYVSPTGAKIAIVGDLRGYDIPKIVEEKLGRWEPTEIEEMNFTELSIVKPEVIDYPINRDQIVLCYAGLSVSRLHPDFDKYLLFDQIFGGGVLHSLNSRLFQLRERSGLFYTINGSLLVGADKEPGMAVIKTIVSRDNLKQSQELIEGVVDTVADTITPQEFGEAQRALINSLANNFESNQATAKAFLFLDKYNFPADFFDTRAQSLRSVDLEAVKKAVKKVLTMDKMLTLRVGRVGKDHE